MSDSQHNSIEQCIVDITECPICTEVLEDNRCLPCLHTFCLKCLESYRKKNAKGKPLPCPVCRREFSIPKSVANLSRNFFIDKLIDAHKIKAPEVLPKNCDICSEDTIVVPATRFCCDCYQNLCLSCEKQHKKIKATSMHQIIDNTDVTDPKEFASSSANCCVHTMKEAEVYCQDCKVVICWQCKALSHSSHASIEISSVAKNLAKQLEEHIVQIAEHLKTKQDEFLKLTEREKLYKDEIEIESANICRELSKLYRKITDNGDKLKKALSASTTAHLDTFRLLRNELDSDISKLKKHKVYIEQMMHLGNVRDLCEYTDKLISETARMAAENACKIIVPPVAHLSDSELQDLLIGRITDIDQAFVPSMTARSRVWSEGITSGAYFNQPLSTNLHSQSNSGALLSSQDAHLGSRPLFSASYDQIPSFLAQAGNQFDRNAAQRTSSSLTGNEQWTPEDNSPFDFDRKRLQKVGQKAGKDKSESETEEKLSGNGSSDALRQMVVGDVKSDSVVPSPCETPDNTQPIAVETLPKQVQNSDELFPKYKSWTHMGTVSVEDGAVICGVTTLDSKMYCVFQHSNSIRVYDSVMFAFHMHVNVDGLANPNDIASCKFNNCLYICDWGKARIFRFEISEGRKQTNWDIDKDLGGISVTAEHNILLAGHMSNKLKEYTSKGKLIRSFSLKDGFKPWHAIRLVSSDFLICQGDNTSEFHRVCLTGSNGKFKKSFGGVLGCDEEHLCGPYHLAVDESGCVFVNDCNNRRILLLSPDLRFIKEFIPSSSNILRRARRMHLDEDAGRLYVADNETKDGKTKNGRILVFSIS